MQDDKIIKACNFYVSEWHLYAALLPYLKDELKKKNRIIFISQDKLEKGLKEITEKINIRFENENGINDITWINDETILDIKNECAKATIIVQGTYDFIHEINRLINDNLRELYKECIVINCFDIFETNDMLHNILNEHDFVFNTGGIHKKEEIFPDYKEEKIIAEKL